MALIFHAKFNETSGTPIDSTGNHVLAIVGSPTQGLAAMAPGGGKSISLTHNDRVNLTPTLDRPASSDFTFTCWYRPDSTVSALTYILGGVGSLDGFGMFRTGASSVEIRLSNARVEITSGPTFVVGADHFVAATRDGTTGAGLIYVDGVEYSAVGTSTKNWEIAFIGGRTASANDCNCSLDDLRVYDEKLSHQQILAIKNGGSLGRSLGQSVGMPIGRTVVQHEESSKG